MRITFAIPTNPGLLSGHHAFDRTAAREIPSASTDLIATERIAETPHPRRRFSWLASLLVSADTLALMALSHMPPDDLNY